jgi:hypothetical protein
VSRVQSDLGIGVDPRADRWEDTINPIEAATGVNHSLTFQNETALNVTLTFDGGGSMRFELFNGSGGLAAASEGATPVTLHVDVVQPGTYNARVSAQDIAVQRTFVATAEWTVRT